MCPLLEVLAVERHFVAVEMRMLLTLRLFVEVDATRCVDVQNVLVVVS